jgi:hypothetical protein
MQAGAHPLPAREAQTTARPQTPSPEAFTHVHAAVGDRADGRRVPSFLPATREFPVGYTVTAPHDVVDEAAETIDLPFTIVRSAELPTPMTEAKIFTALLEADTMVGPSWMPDELAGARFADTDESWLEAWQAHRQRIGEGA